ncbi:MAG: ABC transporter ATP-binding protein [Alkalispirochaeta sp.]
MLKIHDLRVQYGGIKALQGISIEVRQGKIVSLIGANGAGKSTTLRSIAGMLKSVSGSIEYLEKEIIAEKTINIVKSGIVMVPEGRKVFADLTVDENLTMGAYAVKDKKVYEKDRIRVFDLFPRLKERLWQRAGTLSGGEQQMLAVGRALMSRPKLLMMDEPSLGLAPLIVKDIFDIIREINSLGVTVLLVEQNAKAALELCDYAYVLETGRIKLEGSGKKLLDHVDVRKAYLGS